MRTLIGIIGILVTAPTFAQEELFQLHTDSAQWVNTANRFVQSFTENIRKVKPDFHLTSKAILNTQLGLIFYNNQDNTINLPLWQQVVEPQKQFFYQLAGSEDEGRKVFGLLFNGFYLPHELGHAIQYAAGKHTSNEYDNEYFANTIAVLYWRKTGKQKELEECYQYAKKYLQQLPDPIPAGKDQKEYFTAHYHELAQDPYKYGYFQFSQFVKIYEDKTLPGFDHFLKMYLGH